MSFRREKYVPHGGPDGGDGGRGGHVILEADRNESSLVRLYYRPELRAGRGGHGKGKKLYGRNGDDFVACVPCGTEVHDQETGLLLGDLVEHGQQLVVAHGGKGGRGNPHWKSATHQAPTEHTDGEPGEELTLRLELKLVAQAGLVGFPNAGKSSLLARLSDAHPKVAAYPFTTLNPVIGTVVFEDLSHVTVADIPGLIEGAHDGVGLGHAFLRHIERSSLLLFVIDMAATEQREPYTDYLTVQKELELHRADLLDRPSLCIANKMDRPEAKEHYEEFVQKTGITPIPVSAETGEGIDTLKTELYRLVSGNT